MIATDEKPKTILLNLSGEKIEIQIDQFAKYPHTSIAKNIDMHCKEGESNEELFIDRCPTLFRQVLKLVSEKYVILPVGVSKVSLLNEMKFYGFDDIDESKIDDSLTNTKRFGEFLEHGQKLLLQARQLFEDYQENLFFVEKTVKKRSYCLELAENIVLEKFKGISTHFPTFKFKNVTDEELQIVNDYLVDMGIRVEFHIETNTYKSYSTLLNKKRKFSLPNTKADESSESWVNKKPKHGTKQPLWKSIKSIKVESEQNEKAKFI